MTHLSPLAVQIIVVVAMLSGIVLCIWQAYSLLNPKPKQSAEYYTCSLCNGVFEKGWSEEEAIAEKDEDFPSVPLENCAVVCDDCYKKVMGL